MLLLIKFYFIIALLRIISKRQSKYVIFWKPGASRKCARSQNGRIKHGFLSLGVRHTQDTWERKVIFLSYYYTLCRLVKEWFLLWKNTSNTHNFTYKTMFWFVIFERCKIGNLKMPNIGCWLSAQSHS